MSVPGVQMIPMCLGECSCGIKLIVESDIHVVRLKCNHALERIRMSRKAPIGLEHVVAQSYRGLNRPCVMGWDSNRRFRPWSAFGSRVDAVRAELGLHQAPDRCFKRFCKRRASGLPHAWDSHWIGTDVRD